MNMPNKALLYMKQFIAMRKLSHLHYRENTGIRSLAIAFEKSQKKNFTSEEEVWMDKIESLRHELCSSSKEISIIDYGAGSPDLHLTKEEMQCGRISITTVGDICRTCSTPRSWSFFLFSCIREFKPTITLELGTCLGISASYLAAASKLNGAGRVVTLEGDKAMTHLAARNFLKLGLDNACVIAGRFEDTLDLVLTKHGPMDFVFIDGHHDERATLDYFERIYPFLSERAMLIFDDISWSEGMRRAWNLIDSDKRINFSADLSKFGICIIDDRIERKFGI